MTTDNTTNGTATATKPPELTEAQVEQLMEEAYKAKDFKKLATLSLQLAKFEKAKEQAALEAKHKALQEITTRARGMVEFLIDLMTAGNPPDKDAVKQFANSLMRLTGKDIDQADGLWVNWDFGAKREVGINPVVRLIKIASAKKSTGGGGGGQGKKYPSTKPGSELWEAHKDATYKETGMTVAAAWDSNSDKNFRYAIHEFILKQAGLI